MVKRVLVTGATGLLGSHLTKALLERGDDVRVLLYDMHPQSVFAREKLDTRVTSIPGSLQDMKAVEVALAGGIDEVFHLGAQTLVQEGVQDPLLTLEANVRGTYNLLEACRTHASPPKRILCASSDKAYGSSDTLPYTESTPLRGMHPYDASKSCMDIICQMYAHTYGMPICVLRCGNIYGPGDMNWSRLIPGTVHNVLEGKAPELRSDGTFTRDYLFVSDVVDGYLMIADAMEKPEVRGQAFNLGPNEPLSVITVTNEILRLMKSDLKPTILGTAKNEIKDQYLSAEKAKRLTGWTPAHSLEQGLRKTIPWYAEMLGHPVPEGLRTREEFSSARPYTQSPDSPQRIPTSAL